MGNTLPMAGHREIEIGMVLAPAFGEKGAFTPLGMAYLNGALREAGFTPTYVDLGRTMRSEDPDLHGELVSHGFSPDVGGFFGPELDLLLQIGRREEFEDAPLADRILERARADVDAMPDLELALLTLWDSNLYYAAAIGLALKAKGTTVTMGGPSAKLNIVRELLIRMGVVDIVVVGEGEVRVVEIARAVASGAPLSSIGGCMRLGDDGRPVETEPERDLRIHDLPRPSFEGMDSDDWLPIITSRGCIRDCSFCTERFNWRRFRQRRVEDVLEELEDLIARYDCRRFEFNDDLINGHVRWLETFLDALIERDLGLRWTCFMEPYRLTSELIGKLARAGCTLVKYGVQHFDPEMLRVIGRGDEVSAVVDTLRTTADHGIRVSFDIIPGHPNESESSHSVNMRVLPEVLEGHDLLEVNLNPFLLLYGSPVHLAPANYDVVIQTWDETLFPNPLRAEFGDLAPQFMRSYTQTPSRDVVIQRTRQLEAIVRRVRGRHGLTAMPVSADATPELFERLRARGVSRIALRPSRDTTPRHLLDAIADARDRGFSVISLETTGAPLNRSAFVREGIKRGLTHAVLVPGDDVALREAAQAMRDRGLPWVLRIEPGGEELASCIAVADVAHEAGASLLALSMAEATTQTSLAEVADATRRALAHGEALGLGIVVYGLPFCLLSDHVDQLSPTPPVSPVDDAGRPVWGTRLTQPPRCRACELSNRCPGVSEVALKREGEARLTPVAGRPTTDALPTLFERWLMTGEPPRMDHQS
jgi:pyruvate-formate lyase-activating enzyme